jgi:CheY-like chemotaxis protein
MPIAAVQHQGRETGQTLPGEAAMPIAPAQAEQRPAADLLLTDACAVFDRLLAEEAQAACLTPRRRLAWRVVAAGRDSGGSQRAAAWTDGAPPPARGELQGKQVLLVDDCVDALVPMAMLLELSGAEVATAENGLEALARMETKTFDVLVSDLRMPGMTGLELIHAVRTRTAGQQPVAIACSGYTAVPTRDVLAAGFDAMLLKPLAFETLEKTILSLCEAKRG